MKIFFALFLLLSSQCFSQVNLKLGLRVYLPFSGNARDQSGYNNDPVFNNATLTADRFGYPKSAYHFNGRNTYMKILNNPSINMGNKMSISLWVKPMGFYTGRCYNNMMLIKGDADYLQGNYSLRFSDAYTGCTDPTTRQERFYDGAGTLAATPLVKLNQWYHVTVTYDGKTSRLYINCELRASYSTSVSFKNPYDLYIGHLNNDQYPYWLNGDLDEIRIYDRQLNKEEILELCDYKPEIKEPPYVKVKEKKKDVVPVVKKQAAKPGTAIAPPPLIATSNQEEVKAGFIKLSSFDNEQEVLLKERKKEMTREITVDTDSVSVTLYDNGEIDGDSITLIYNDKILTTHQRLTDKPLTFWIKIAPGNSRNELVMYAENLGSIPPNTALMVIYDGQKRYEVNIKSTEKTNGSVSFKLRE
jgi:Concanavalin A-like lectin/glucanases superfamily